MPKNFQERVRNTYSAEQADYLIRNFALHYDVRFSTISLKRFDRLCRDVLKFSFLLSGAE